MATRPAVSSDGEVPSMRTSISRTYVAGNGFHTVVSLPAGNSLGCYVADNSTGACSSSSGTDNPLTYGYDAHLARIDVKFPDITNVGSPVPAEAVVNDAQLTMTEKSAANSTPLPTGILRLGANWSSGMTWSNQPAYAGTWKDDVSVTPPGVDKTVTFDVPEAARGWIEGTGNGGYPNYGLQIRLKKEVKTNALTFYGFANPAHRPQLTVDWNYAVGQQPWVQAYDHRISDRSDLHVDIADRNLVVNGTDETVRGPGESLAVRRTYNALAAASEQSGAFGRGWVMNGGSDMALHVTREQATFAQAGGAVAWFVRNFDQPSLTVKKNDGNTAGASFVSSPGLKADLTKPDDTHYKLNFRTSHAEYTFTVLAGTSTAYLSSMDDGHGNAVKYTVDPATRHTTAITDATGMRSVSLDYKGDRVSGMTEHLASDPGSARSWSYEYDGNGNLTRSIDPAHEATQYCYTSNLLTRVITARGTDDGADCSSQGDHPGMTSVAYDAGGHLTSVTFEDAAHGNATVQFATSEPMPPGDSSGATTLTDPYGNVTTYTYDTSGKVTLATSPLGYKASTKFNTSYDVTASVDPNNFTGGSNDPATTATYTGDNLTKLSTPTGANIQGTYSGTEKNQPDNMSDDMDPDNKTPGDTSPATHLSYNGSGQLSGSKRAKATVTVRRQGDSGVANCGPGTAAAFKGAVCETRDANYDATHPTEHRTLYRYNAMGEMTSMTPSAPDHGRPTPAPNTYEYDAHSRVHVTTDARGNRTTYDYDALDRLTRATYADGSSTRNVYDSDGNQLSAGDYTPAGAQLTDRSLTYTYDDLNRLATQQQGGEPRTIQGWDANSQLRTFDDGSGDGVTRYGYNSDGSLTSMVEPGGDCSGYTLTDLPPADKHCILFDVDRNGHRLRTVFPGDVAEQIQEFDADGKPSRVAGTGLSGGRGTTYYDYAYDYTHNGQKTGHVTVRRDAAGPERREYSYDEYGRLTQDATFDALSGGTRVRGTQYCFANDKIGNRTGSGGIGTNCATNPAIYDGANQRDGVNYTYDADGNETKAATSGDRTRTSTWSNSEQLASATPNGDPERSYVYAGPGNGMLVESDISVNGSTALDNTPLGITRVHLEGKFVPTRDLWIERDPTGGLVGFRDGSQHYYYETDNLGSVLRVLDANGVGRDSYDYDSFGTPDSFSITVYQPFGYTGAFTSDMGLVHLQSRWYDPYQGRFTQRDPQDHPTDTKQNNPYAYAGNDPVNGADPSGQTFVSVGLSVNIGPVQFGVGAKIGDGGVHPTVSAGIGASTGLGAGASKSVSAGTASRGNSVSAEVCAVTVCRSADLQTHQWSTSSNLGFKPSATLTDTYTF